MPFVPLGSRKRHEVILDGDKQLMQQKQHDKDHSTIQRHIGAAPGKSGYTYANHPSTLGVVRPTDVPFAGATSSWRPPSADPGGPASRRNREVADYGAIWEASHSFRQSRSRSTPQLATAGANLMEACHPLGLELKRWQTMAGKTVKNELGGQDCLPEPKKPSSPAPAPHSKTRPGGLVNFPKYMLINQCHLKTMDLQRFQKQQQEEAQLYAEEMAARGDFHEEPMSPSLPESLAGSMRRGEMPAEASWGAPFPKGEKREDYYAGSTMPAGRGMRTSNPFRMG
mmetsp:Transcript_46557/g.120507  ORF Transcript_46557/g.120507 Transcript_46557/m.120507 type:complete len:283 (-) Transcript_46557:53-901(-)